MKINRNETIVFENADMPFVKKFGQDAAEKMVLDYKFVNATPFIYDTFQLADFLKVTRSKMFDMVRNTNRYYRHMLLPKKSGYFRNISAPKFPLNHMQRKILDDILKFVPISKYATAYKKGAMLYENAKPHTNKKYLLKLDITDFFGSIDFFRVYSTAFNTKYYPKQIGWILTSICCKDEVLPQGAPTSPMLSNIVLKNFDDNIGNWCKKRGIAYTRYCDDMTFSSDKPLYYVYKKVKTLLEDMGFEINEEKTKFISNSARQTVTGLTVNEKVSVPRDYKRKLRQEVYYVLKNGFDDTACSKICGADLTAFSCYNRLVGKINYVLQIEPDNTWFKDALWKIKMGL